MTNLAVAYSQTSHSDGAIATSLARRSARTQYVTHEPLVLLPGLLCDQHLWRSQVEALADIAAPVVADLTLDDTVEGMARRVLASAPSRFSLAGLSMGGYVALEIMRLAPERVARLALVSTSARPETAERQEERLRGIASLRRGRFVGVTHGLLKQLVHPQHFDGPVAADLRTMAARIGKTAFIRQQQAIMTRRDARSTLSRIIVPTLVAVGDGDVTTPPACANEMHQAVQGSRLHVFKGCGHLPAMESPVETASLLREWLSC